MAQRRMFSKKITHTDAFIDMPEGSKVLYFYLAMEADDDGFVDSPKRIMAMLGTAEDNYKILVAKKFILPFDSGICVVKHWLIHNYIQKDRYSPTQWIEEREMLEIDEKTNKYSLKSEDAQNVSKMYPQVRLEVGKVRSGQDSKREEPTAPTPAQIARDFFTNVDGQWDRAVDWLVEKGLDEQTAKNELGKFISYWTEPTKSGKKQRWELETAFEIRRRLATWVSRLKNDFKANSAKLPKLIKV